MNFRIIDFSTISSWDAMAYKPRSKRIAQDSSNSGSKSTLIYPGSQLNQNLPFLNKKDVTGHSLLYKCGKSFRR